MRDAIASLTTRGRAFVSSGLTAIGCALLLGLDDLGRVGGLLLALPLVSARAVTRGRHQLTLSRSLSTAQVPVSQPAHARLAVGNEGRAPTGLLLLEEQVPPALGPRPRFIVDRMGPRWRRTVTYPVVSELRGRFQVGPLQVRVSDPFGLVEVDHTFRSTSALVVTPPVLPLPAVPLTGTWTGSGDNRPRDFAGGSAEDVTVREYRRGDDLRRVHWRSSAHAGELMVRREEQPWQSRATVFIDNRRHVHQGSGTTSTLEYAVTAAASVAMHLARRGFRVRLLTAEGGEAGAGPDHGWHEHGATASEAGPLLESLAVLRATPQTQLDARWLADAPRTGLLVGVMGAVSAADQGVLSRIRHAASGAMAIAPDEGATALLIATGWRAVTAAPGQPLAAVWRELGMAVPTAGSAR